MFPDMATSEVSTGLWPTPHGMGTDGHGNELAMAVYVTEGISTSTRSRARSVSPPLISSPAASRASRGAWPGSDGEPRTIVGSGPSSSEPFVNYDPGTSSWRTSQGSWLEEEAWGLSSEDWPRSGMTRNGTAFRQAPSAPLTGATASGSLEGPNSLGQWPTPTTGDHSTRFAQGGMPLGMAARMWPTPTVQDAENDAGPSQWSRNSDPLNVAVKRWPTPTSADGLGGPGNSGRDGGENLRTAAGGQLNPTWVEWLMGFPAGWTDCEHLATPSFRRSLKRSGGG
jgi:hypothetical protein